MSPKLKSYNPIPLRIAEIRMLLDSGQSIQRLVVEKRREGYRAVIFTGGHTDPFLVSLKVGVPKTWAEMDSVVRWLHKYLPQVKTCELHLIPFL